MSSEQKTTRPQEEAVGRRYCSQQGPRQQDDENLARARKLRHTMRSLNAELEIIGNYMNKNVRTLAQVQDAAVAAQHEAEVHDRCKHVGSGCHVEK